MFHTQIFLMWVSRTLYVTYIRTLYATYTQVLLRILTLGYSWAYKAIHLPTGFLCQHTILPLLRGCANQSLSAGGMGTHSKGIIKGTGLHTEESKEAKAWRVTERSKTFWLCYKYQSWKMDFHSIIRNLCKKPSWLIYSLSWWWAHTHNYDLYGTQHWINSVTDF